MIEERAGVKSHKAVWIIVALFFVVGCCRINDLCIYTPDSTLYVIWATALAHGHGFIDNTGPEPNRFIMNAPLYAVLIAPIELLFPRSLEAVKYETLLFGCAAIALLYFYLFRLAGKRTALLGTILFAFNPFTIIFSSEALSEAPFAAAVLALLLLVEKIIAQTPPLETNGKPKASWEEAAFVLSASLLPLLREVGLAVVVAVILFLVLRRKFSLAAAAFGGALIVSAAWYVRNNILVGAPPGVVGGNLSLLTQNMVTPEGTPILVELATRLWHSGLSYVLHIASMLFFSVFANEQFSLAVEPGGAYVWLQAFVIKWSIEFGIGILPIVAAGVVQDFRTTRTALCRVGAMLLLAAAIFVYPLFDLRFLFPLLPLMVYEFLIGVRWLLSPLGGRLGLQKYRAFQWCVLLLCCVPNALALGEILKTNLEYRFSPDALYDSAQSLPAEYTWPWERLADWIGKHVEKDAVIVCPVKDLARVVSTQKVGELAPIMPPYAFDINLRDNGVSYIVAPVLWGNFRLYEYLMAESRHYVFVPAVAMQNILMYRVVSRALHPDMNPPETNAFDSTSAAGYLMRGRAKLVAGLYRQADTLFRKSQALIPAGEEQMLQLTTVAVMMDDTTRAVGRYARLVRVPQARLSMAYASNLLQNLRLDLAARLFAATDEGAAQLLSAIRGYDELGYPRRAVEIADTLLKDNPRYFSGLLWAFHFNLQLGDTAKARGLLARLLAIDSTNIVADAFRRIMNAADSIAVVPSAPERSRLYMTEARLYAALELPEQALDAADRARYEQPQNTDADLFEAAVFKQENRIRTSARFLRDAVKAGDADPAVAAELTELEKSLE